MAIQIKEDYSVDYITHRVYKNNNRFILKVKFLNTKTLQLFEINYIII